MEGQKKNVVFITFLLMGASRGRKANQKRNEKRRGNVLNVETRRKHSVHSLIVKG